MDARSHWEHVYKTKSPAERSWYEPHLQTSLDWISGAATSQVASIIDVGGGESTLVDDLLARGFRALTVLDLADAAIKKCQERLGPAANNVSWLAADVTQIVLPAHTYDIWHDRAVFHFLNKPEQRLAYIDQLTSSLKPEGNVVMATFGPDGPEKCSGLVTTRYDAKSLLNEMGPAFRLVRSSVIEHCTPFGTAQQFLYCHFRRG